MSTWLIVASVFVALYGAAVVLIAGTVFTRRARERERIWRGSREGADWQAPRASRVRRSKLFTGTSKA